MGLSHGALLKPTTFSKPGHITCCWWCRMSVYVSLFRKYLERALRGKFDLEGTTVSVVYETTRQRDAVRNCPLEIASFIWDAYDREEETKYTALCA